MNNFFTPIKMKFLKAIITEYIFNRFGWVTQLNFETDIILITSLLQDLIRLRIEHPSLRYTNGHKILK